ncbi:MAG: hypothetical protein V2I27_05140 [Erythrobacter sp.]|nr:hypothetical protein [Erythrobacter sp.]
MRVIVGLGLALCLAACEGASTPDSGAAGEEGGKAEGEILGGTISDDMLPLAELRSVSPPRAPVATPDAGAGAGAGAAAQPQEVGSPEEAAEPQPQSAPETQAEAAPDPAPEPR